jgi:hypothetical protein
MVKILEQAIAEVERLPAEDQEQIGRTCSRMSKSCAHYARKSTRASARSIQH